MKKKWKIFATVLSTATMITMFSSCSQQGETSSSLPEENKPDWSVASPDGKISVELYLDNGQLSYTVKSGETSVMEKSALGLTTTYNLFDNLKFVKETKQEKTYSYSNISGKTKEVTTSFKETALTFSENDFYLGVTVRAYNDGYAFRYDVKKIDESTGTFTIEEENTHFVLPEDAQTYGMKYVANSGVLGVENGDYYAYEEKYQRLSYKNISSELIGYPMLYYFDDGTGNNVYSLLMESDIYGRDYHASFLAKDGNYGLKTIHSPASGSKASLEATYPFTSPWRVGIVGGLDTITESNLVEDVYDDIEPWKPDNYDSLSTEEKEIYNYDWVLPGCAAWSYLNYDTEDRKHTSQHDYTEQKRYVDAIAELNWTWLVLDAGWNEKGFNANDFKEFVQYANSKGIHIMVWADSFQHMRTKAMTISNLEKWASWGIEGIKVDFFDGQTLPYMSEEWRLNSQQSLDDHYQMIYQETAKRKMVVDCHGCNIPTGERRQYPHVINREAIRGYEHKNVDSAQTVVLPFTRGTIGPSDFTPAIIPYSAGNVTTGHNMGLALTLESGMPTFSDIPEHYSSENNYFDFYKDLPAV